MEEHDNPYAAPRAGTSAASASPQVSLFLARLFMGLFGTLVFLFGWLGLYFEVENFRQEGLTFNTIFGFGMFGAFVITGALVNLSGWRGSRLLAGFFGPCLIGFGIIFGAYGFGEYYGKVSEDAYIALGLGALVLFGGVKLLFFALRRPDAP